MSCVYIGPQKPFGLPIRHNAILAAEPEKVFPQIKPLFEAHPAMRQLFVPARELAGARKALASPGSPLARACSEIKAASDEAKE